MVIGRDFVHVVRRGLNRLEGRGFQREIEIVFECGGRR
jgi:hypothetical protein